MRMQNKLGAAILTAVLLGAGAMPAAAQKSADTLRIVMRDALPNIDPYYNNLRTGVVMHHQGWDALVYRNPDTFKLEPLLATEWKQPDATTIEFTLRPGVKFHDGSPFTADDVVYTINLIADPASRLSTPSNYNWLDKAEKTGDLSVRVKLKRPNPAALEYFALVIPIYPKAYREKVGAEGYAKAPVGAGPYKMTKVEPGVSIDFERFEDYWAGSPKGKPAIKKMSVRFVPDAATEMTELLAGRADWIWNLNPDQFEPVNRMPHLQAVRKESMRIGYLSLDAGGRTGADNPMTKLKVRQAIWYAIDRKAIADKLVTGGSRVPLAPCVPSQFGCDGEIATTYDYNPAKAKQLLTEAGYPDGFDVELASYVLPQWGSAVQNYLHCGRHPRQAQPASDRRADPARQGRRTADVSRKLGQLFDQRRLGHPAQLLRWRCRRLCARSGRAEMAGRGRIIDRPGSAQEGLFDGAPAHHRAGLLGALAQLCDDLWSRKAARLHAIPGRTAALLSGEVELRAARHLRLPFDCSSRVCATRFRVAPVAPSQPSELRFQVRRKSMPRTMMPGGVPSNSRARNLRDAHASMRSRNRTNCSSR